jgi:hypothetical protein
LFAALRLGTLLVTGVFVIGGCAAGGELAPPWQLRRTITNVTPQEQAALWADEHMTLIAWPGDPAMPNIRLLDADRQGDPLVLPLGIKPGPVSLYPLSSGRFQLLWIDWALPGEGHLVGGTLDPNLAVLRGPTDIADRSVLEFSAAPTARGDLAVFWSEVGSVTTPIYSVLIDSLGRPRSSINVTASGRYPAAAYDRHGDLHVAWLEPGAGRLWSIRYTSFPAGEIPKADADKAAVPVGVIRLETDQALDSFTLGVDASEVYILWGTIKVNGGVRGALAGLTFPIGQDEATRSLKLDMPGTASVRWPAVASGQTLVDGLVLSLTADDARPFVIILSPNGIVSVESITADRSSLVGKTALCIDAQNRLHLVWSAFQPSGEATIYYATRDKPVR